MSRTYYSPEVKAEAVIAASKPGATAQSVSEETGIRSTLISRWVRESKQPKHKKRSWLYNRTNEWVDRVNDLTVQLEEKDAMIAELQSKANGSGNGLPDHWDDTDIAAEIANLNSALDHKDAIIEDLRKELAKPDVELKRLNDLLGRKDEEIAVLKDLVKKQDEVIYEHQDKHNDLEIELKLIRDMMVLQEKERRRILGR